MLEAQKDRMNHRSRLRAQGVPEEEISSAQQRPFRPAFVNGKRKERDASPEEGLPSVQFAFRRQG
ncbi:MAG: hypothetical protein R3F13_11080 [Prosthecobacter sp.]